MDRDVGFGKIGTRWFFPNTNGQISTVHSINDWLVNFNVSHNLVCGGHVIRDVLFAIIIHDFSDDYLTRMRGNVDGDMK